MSSKSLTAVTSFVSVIRDKTVFVLRLNVKGCQRVAAPIAIIVFYLLAVGMFIAAGATDQMLKVWLTRAFLLSIYMGGRHTIAVLVPSLHHSSL